MALAGKDALLHWCQQRATPYRRCGIAVENFATSFADGRAFVALVHSQWPASVPHPQTLAAEDAQANLTLAFDAAEAKGVFRLLDAELIASSGKPEPKTVMTYLAELRKQIRKAEGVVVSSSCDLSPEFTTRGDRLSADASTRVRSLRTEGSGTTCCFETRRCTETSALLLTRASRGVEMEPISDFAALDCTNAAVLAADSCCA